MPISTFELLAAAGGDSAFLLAASGNITWYMVPLAAAVSLVYSASRYELPERVLRRAARLTVTILGFMSGVLLVLWLLSRNL